MLLHAAVVVATSLAERQSLGIQNCTAGGWFRECEHLDVRVSPEHLRWPWAVCLGALVALGCPTVLLQSNRRVQGVLQLCASLAQGLLCMLAATQVPHRSLAYAITMHGSVAVLAGVQVGPWFVLRELWGLRYLAAWMILLGAFLYGPALSVVEWPDQAAHVTCAAVVHLLGILVPGGVFSGMRGLGAWGRDILRAE